MSKGFIASLSENDSLLSSPDELEVLKSALVMFSYPYRVNSPDPQTDTSDNYQS